MANQAQAVAYSRKLLFLEQLNHIKTSQVIPDESCRCVSQMPWMMVVQEDSKKSEQPGLVEGDSAHGRRLELGDLQGPFQPKLFHNSTIPSIRKKD